MSTAEGVRVGLNAALSGADRGREVARRLCAACVDLLDVDGAALSLVNDGVVSRSLGASGALSRELDELQFTLGEGPCVESVRLGSPVLVGDLNDTPTHMFPLFAGAALERGVRAVFALPVSVAGMQVGALDLYRVRTGPLGPSVLAGGVIAAEMAALPVLDLMGMDLGAALSDETSAAWAEVASLSRVEVHQATGMLIAQLRVRPAEALVRLRSYAFAHDMSTTEVAVKIIDRRLRLGDDNPSSNQEQGGK